MTDFHAKPFDEGTLAKLELYRDYIQEWLPVWVAQAPGAGRITIADFFAGPGRDQLGRPGSPLIALKVIRRFADSIRRSGAEVRLELNEAVDWKAELLRTTLEAETVPPALCTFDVTSLDFNQAFDQSLSELRKGPNLLLLDQQGIKFISDRIFRELVSLEKTDFIFFVASSTLRRFEEHPNIRRPLALRTGTITAKEFNDTHRAVHGYYRALAKDAGGTFYMGRFSIKKGSNIYGLIFGSGHCLGIEKFLRVCWRADPVRGEANFDIDQDNIDEAIPRLFPEMDVPKKLQVFQNELSERITGGSWPRTAAFTLLVSRMDFSPSTGERF